MVDEARPTERRRIEIVHESLLTKWPRLVRWQAQDAEGALLRDHLRQAAQTWEERGRPEDLLWSGSAYREFSVWRARYLGALSAGEEAFARAAVSRAERRKRRTRFAVAAVLMLVLAVAIVTTVLWRNSVASERLARAESRRAEAQKLLALAQLDLESYPTAALTHTTKSLELADTPEARRMVMDILWRGPTARILQLAPGGGVAGNNFSPDGTWMFAGQGTDFLVPNTGQRPRRLDPDSNLGSFSADGRFLVTRGQEKVHVFSVPEGKLIRTIPVIARLLFKIRGSKILIGSPIESEEMLVQFVPIGEGATEVIGRFDVSQNYDVHPSGSWGVVLRDDAIYQRAIREQSAQHKPVDVVLWRPRQKPTDVNFSQDGELLVATTDSGIELYSIGEQKKRWLAVPSEVAGGVRGPFHIAGSKVVAATGGSGSSRIWVWDLEGPQDVEPLTIRWGGPFVVTDGNFHPSGKWLVMTSHTSLHSFWPLGRPYPQIFRIPKTTGLAKLAYTPDSKWLAVCAEPGGLQLFSLKAGLESRKIANPEGWCHCLAVDKAGENLLAGGFNRGVFLTAISGESSRRVLEVPRIVPWAVAFHPSGRTAVVNIGGRGRRPAPVLTVVDLPSGKTQTFPGKPLLSDGTPPFPIRTLGFAVDGTLISAGDGGIRRWDLTTGANSVIHGDESVTADIAMSGNGRFMLAVVGKGDWSISGKLLLFDLVKGTQSEITTHGSDFFALAIDTSGKVIATTDSTGVVRVGKASGEEPHLLLGHRSNSWAVTISPDGRWIASGSEDEIRLWPMPDLSKPPLHILPHDQLMAKLHELTNLRAVPDETSATGYKLEIGPFPGWQKVPTW